MLLLFHVIIALSSVAYTTYLFFSPSKSKLRVSYGLIGLTLASGTYLVLSTHAPMLQSCEAGLFYISIVTVGVAVARRKLAAAKLNS